MNEQDREFMQRAIELARRGIERNDGGPFGAVVVRDGRVVGEGCNRVTSTNDPTAHAEIVAIREACRNLNSFQLADCVIYTSCEPCPMCLGAIYWARPKRLVYAGTRDDAAEAGFDDGHIYEEIALAPEERRIETVNFMREAARQVFNEWVAKDDKIEY
jgi:guanine deaminase